MKKSLCVLAAAFALFSDMSSAYFLPVLELRQTDIDHVYDGDTFYVNIQWLPDTFGKELGVRLVGIDTPELRSSCDSDEQRVHERELARAAKDILTNILYSAQTITLILKSANHGRDKYFRVDATVLADGLNVNEELIKLGYAVEYDGSGSRPSWCTL